MEKLLIKGGNSLSGKISCSGAKNAALPMIASTILSNESVVLKNLPYLQDITTMFELLGSMGAEILLDENMNFTISSFDLKDIQARYELVKTMRASILVLGPLVAKYGKARIALPGGCAIGSRPVNYHLDALKQLGAKIKLINNRSNNNENICDIEVVSSDLHGCELGPEFADLMIDEYPILSIAATFAKSPSVFRGLKELRVKESDRLKLILLNLQKCGVNCKTENDDLFIFPSKEYQIKNNLIQTDFDHRIAMAFCIMGTKLGPLNIKDSDSISTSFPTFKNEFNNLGGNIY